MKVVDKQPSSSSEVQSPLVAMQKVWCGGIQILKNLPTGSRVKLAPTGDLQHENLMKGVAELKEGASSFMASVISVAKAFFRSS